MRLLQRRTADKISSMLVLREQRAILLFRSFSRRSNILLDCSGMSECVGLVLRCNDRERLMEAFSRQSEAQSFSHAATTTATQVAWEP